MRRRDFTIATALALGLAATAAPAHAQGKPPLIVTINTDLSSIDPYRILSGTDYIFFGNVFEGLFGHDKSGVLEPALAEAVEIGKDGLTYDFKLRAGVTFHNGDPFSAEDVRFSWQRAVDPALRNPRAAVVAANIADVEIVGPLQVRIRLKRPDAAFLENLDAYWHIVPKGYIEKVGSEEFARKPVGTGPFAFVERKPREYVKLRAFDAHWGRVPKVGELTLKIVPDEQIRMAQLQTGESDINTGIPVALAARSQRATAFKIHHGTAFSNAFLVISAYSSNPHLAKPEVRRALDMAVDKATLMKAITFGFATPNVLACHPVMQGCDAKAEANPFDPKAAREMLVKAGFDFSRPLKLVSYTSGEMPLIIQGVAQYFDRIGVKTTIDIMETGAYVALTTSRVKDPTTDLIIEAYPDYNHDPSGRLRRLFRTGETVSYVADPQIDAMIDKMNDFVSREERLDHIRALFRMLHDKSVMVTLWSTATIYAARSNIAWDPPGNYWPIFWNVTKN